jgi:purine catabolism regulator
MLGVPMLLTLKDVLNIEIFQKSTTLTANTTLHKHYVESISVLEKLVDSYGRKNELVLTTAISCGHEPELFYDFVHGVIQAEASALVVAIGQYITEIPENVKRLAEEHDFPIIEMPWEFRFSDIIHSVLSEIYNWQRITLRQSQEMQEELLKLFLSKADLSNAAESIYKKIARPIVIIDNEGNLQGKSKNSDLLLKFWKENTQNEIHWEPLELTNKITQTNIRYTLWEQVTFLQVNITSATILQGYILLAIPENSTLEDFFTDDKDLLLEHAATSAALWFQRDNTIKETEIRLRDDFVWNLTKNQTESWDIITSRAKLLGFDIERPYVCILGLLENLEEIYEGTNTVQMSYEYWFQNTIRQFEDKIIQVGKISKNKVMTTFQQNNFIIFLETSSTSNNNIKDTISSYLGYLEKKIKEAYPTIIISWGIGENHAGIKTFQKSFNDAKAALEIGLRQKGPGYRNTCISTGSYRILQSLSDNEDVKEILLTTIGKLVQYDKEKESDLVKTLMVCIRNRSNVSQTARELILHRQSLLYRLGKIETLTGLSLSDPDDMFLLDLCLKLWEMGYYK